MSNANSILDSLKRREKPVVPSGFFDDFFDSLMTEIDAESGLLGQLSKRKKPILPAGYFEQKTDFMEELNEAPLLSALVLAEKPTLAETFFDQFPDQLQEQLTTLDASKITRNRIIPLWLTTGISAIAATLAIFFIVRGLNSGIDEPIAVSEPLEEETFDAYLSYLDEDEIIDYLLESDIDITTNNSDVDEQTYEDYSTEDIEDYYLEEFL